MTTSLAELRGKTKAIFRVGKIRQRILLNRGEKVRVDADLAEAYSVTPKALNQAIRRNADRFPPDLMLRLTKEEKVEAVTNGDHLEKLKFSPVTPYAFGERDATMAASVLNSPRATEGRVFVVRAFVQLRETLAGSIKRPPMKLNNSNAGYRNRANKSSLWSTRSDNC